MRFQMSARWLRFCALALGTLLAAGCGTGDGEESVDATADDSSNAEFKLVFEDDFGGAAPPVGQRSAAKAAAKGPVVPLSTGNWRVDEGYGPSNSGWGNDEWQLYRNSITNLFQQDGSLVIRAACSDPNNGDRAINCGKRNGTITSAKIITKDRINVRFGKIQARIKMPSGAGMWPAFWTLGSDIDVNPWPDAGEIDIVEMHYYFSDTRTTHFSTHWGGPRYTDENRPVCAANVAAQDPDEEENCKTVAKAFDFDLTDDFHVFELVWNENTITGKIDGITYFTQGIDPATMEEFLKDHYLILNVAVGGTLGGPNGPSMSEQDWADTDQTDMLVDWVRVFETPPPSGATLIDESGKNLPFNRIINSAEFGGAFVASDEDSTTVTPLKGDKVLEIDYRTSRSENGGGVPADFAAAIFDFNNLEVTPYDHLVFSIDSSRFFNFFDLGIELEDSKRYRAQVRTSDYQPTINGNWYTYTIPLSHFNGDENDPYDQPDPNAIAQLKFIDPLDSNGSPIAGTLYVDDIRFGSSACSAVPTVAFDSMNYNPATSLAQVNVNDPCAAGKLVTLKVDAGAEEIIVSANLDIAGEGRATFGFVDPLSVCPTNDSRKQIALTAPIIATYTGANGDVVNAAAGVDDTAVNAPILGQARYIFATDPNQRLEYRPDNEFKYSDFNSGSQFDGNFTDDDTFSPVFAVSDNPDVGGQAAVLAHFAFTNGYTADKASINFKIKEIPQDKVFVQFGDGETAFEVDLVNDTDLSKSIGDGWYEVSIPMSNFPNVDRYNYLVIKSNDSPTSNFTFLVTDIFLRDSLSVVPDACAQTIDPDELTSNGNFELGNLSGLTVIPGAGTATVEIDGSKNNTIYGAWSAKIKASRASAVAIKLANLGVGVVMPGDYIDVVFDIKGTVKPGCSINAQLISEGTGGGQSASLGDPIVDGQDNWSTFSFSGFVQGDVAGGVTLQFDAACGDVAGARVDANLDNVSVAIGEPPANVASVGVFEDAYVDSWEGWVCCGGAAITTPAATDSYFGDVVDINYTGTNTIGGLSYGPEGDRSILLDVSAIANSGGTLEFDALQTRAPAAGVWTLKLEGQNGGVAVEVPFTASEEGVLPTTGEWQHYTFDIGTTLSGGTMDFSKVKLILIFSNFGNNGGQIQIDNVEFKSAPVSDVFENAYVDSWEGWVCCGGAAITTPAAAAADSYFGDVVDINYTGTNTIGGLSYGPEGDRSILLDVSAFEAIGSLEFDALQTRAPAAGVWTLKLEGQNGGVAVEVPFTASEEGVLPTTGEWQHYTFDIGTTLSGGTMDFSKVKLILIFSNFGNNGGQIQIDNVEFRN